MHGDTRLLIYLAIVVAAVRAHDGTPIVYGNARFTVHSRYIIRIEYSESGFFDDLPSTTIVNRNVYHPCTTTITSELLQIEVDNFVLQYQPSGLFSKNTLNITINMPNNEKIVWYPGLNDDLNLHGTVHSLDQCKGPVDLGQGILSRSGWSFIDDSHTLLIDNTTNWVTSRRQDRIDWIFSGYDLFYFKWRRSILISLYIGVRGIIEDVCTITRRLPVRSRFLRSAPLVFGTLGFTPTPSNKLLVR